MAYVLVTGANGFLGKYLVDAFSNHGHRTLGLLGCDYDVDLSLTVPEFKETYNKVVHAAGMAHVQPKTKESGCRFFDVNVTGTENLLKGLEKLSQLPETLIFISTVAVYGLDEGENINESAPLNGNTPYAISKISAEYLVREWGERHNVKTVIFRLPLIAGANPPGNLGAMIRAINKGYYFSIGVGRARRSMVLAEDVADLINKCNNCHGIYNLTDGYHPSIRELAETIAKAYDRRIKVMPSYLVRLAVKAGDLLPFIPVNSLKLEKLTSTLTFSDEKVRRELGWSPRMVLEHLEL